MGCRSQFRSHLLLSSGERMKVWGRKSKKTRDGLTGLSGFMSSTRSGISEEELFIPREEADR